MLVCFTMLMGAIGCGPAAIESPPPLTIAEWKALPVARKYDAESFERLKQGEPSLAIAEKWLEFHRNVVVPSRKRDLPTGPK
jgi:hypothetical protein